MYYIEKNNKIALFSSDKQVLENTIRFSADYKDAEIQETEEGYTIVDFELVTIEEYNLIELNKAKQVKIQENDTARDEALNQGVTYKDILFDSDTDQKVNLLATVSMMSDDDVITWYGKDNQPLVCTKQDLLNIGGLITQLHSFCWTKNAEIKSEISEATTSEELDNIEIDYVLAVEDVNGSNGGEQA